MPEGFLPAHIRDAEDVELKRTWLHDKTAEVVDAFVNISDTTSAVATGVLVEEQQPTVCKHFVKMIYVFV